MEAVKSRLLKIIFFFNILFGSLLFLSYAGPFLKPSEFYLISLLSLSYPLMLGINLFFCVLWIYLRRRYFYFSFVLILLGIQHLFSIIQFGIGQESASQTVGTNLNIASYNVRYFNANQFNSERQRKNAQLSILNSIEALPMDIFCGQEFSGKNKENNQTAVEFLRKKGLIHKHSGGLSSLAIHSKYPIVQKGIISFKNSYNGAIYADIQIEKKTIRVYCLHLQSIGLKAKELDLLDQNEKDKRRKYKNIYDKLYSAYSLREEQASKIVQHALSSSHPVLICGDFNDTPNSYTYRTFSRHFKDAFMEAGLGLGTTYAGMIPLLRIDFLMSSPEIAFRKFKVLRAGDSDHWPIWSSISI